MHLYENRDQSSHISFETGEASVMENVIMLSGITLN